MQAIPCDFIPEYPFVALPLYGAASGFKMAFSLLYLLLENVLADTVISRNIDGIPE